MIQLGTIQDGRILSYDATLYEFRVSRNVVTHADVAELDRAGHISWLAPEQRDWFWRINPQDLDRCNREALGRHGNGYEGLTPEEQVLADAKRDDSVLAGKIVDADPALVRAVADALEAQGLVGHASHAHTTQPTVVLPQGMEALGQLQNQEGRKMTLMEHFLMRQILKADDKAKLKREKEADSIEAAALKEEEREEAALKKNGKIHKGQKRMEKRESQREQELRQRSVNMQVEKQAPAKQHGMTAEQALAMAETGASARLHVTADAMTAVASQATGNVQYYDSYGNPIRPEADAIRPGMTQVAHQLSAEEKALVEMRERNLAAQAQVSGPATESYVPGMEKRKRGINDGASINGRAVNADGSPKETRFTKFVGGLGKVVDAVSPLAGGGRGGGGMGGGAGGGSGMGSGMGGGGRM